MLDRPLTISAALSFSWKKVTASIPVVVIVYGAFQLVNRVLFRSPDLRLVWWLWSSLGFLLLAKLSLVLCDDEKVEMRGLFGCYQQIWPYLGAYVLFIAATSLGFVLLVIPGLVMLARCWLFPYLIIDRKLGPVTALRTSFEMARPVYLRILLMMATTLLVIFVTDRLTAALAGRRSIYVAGAMVAPFVNVAMAYFYRTLSPRESSRANSEEMV